MAKVDVKDYRWKCSDSSGKTFEHGIVSATFDAAYQSMLAIADFYGWHVGEYLGTKEVDDRLLERD